ncbi:TetR/AcrR family transcriptional regulator [Mycolicibacterium porcinum]|nr:TetR family transcriptional regulator [Mycolicibacterium porcinum]
MTQSARAAMRQSVLQNARELFYANGIRQVTISDVARASGCTRQMVYKVFFDRRELILTAVVERIIEIADAATVGAPVPADSFHAAFVELSVQVIESLRNDPELSELTGDDSPLSLHEALWSSELVDRALRFWEPWLSFGRAHRLLRDDLTNTDLADWLHTVYASIILRRNIPREQERIMIEHFVMTSLTMAGVTPGA